MTVERRRGLRTVLAATELGEGGLAAMEAAGHVALPGGTRQTRIHVVYVAEEPAFVSGVGGAGRGEESPEGPGGEVATLPEGVTPRPSRPDLEAQARAAGLDPARIGVHFASGVPHREIHRLSLEIQADLVILGAHRPRRLLDGLLGSTADRVLRTSHCPVLILGQPLEAPPRRLLVASDLSPHSSRALQTALGWCREWIEADPSGGRTLELDVLAIADYARPGYRALPLDRLLRRQLESLGGDLPPALRVSTRSIAFPRAAEGIHHVSEERGTDLLFMGSHGHGPLLRTLFGSVTSEVVRTLRLATVVVPPGKEA